jgi:hypothetical protein
VSGSSHHHDHDHTEPPSELALRVKALESLLIEKGLVDSAAIDALIDTYETKVGPRNGAQVVARAWSDPAFKQWLLTDATAAIASIGYTGRQRDQSGTSTGRSRLGADLLPALAQRLGTDLRRERPRRSRGYAPAHRGLAVRLSPDPAWPAG